MAEDQGTGAPLAAAVVETHISVLFFLGDRVHKLKKPVRLPFIDLTRREERERLCHREVELNRRLAPDVYLGVADVTGPDGDLCDHLVVMRRLAAGRRLSTLVSSGAPEVGTAIDALGRLIAVFHDDAARDPAVGRAGGRAQVRHRCAQLFSEIRLYGDDALDQGLVDEADELVDRFLTGRNRLFTERVEGGWIRDGHGDLQADDVFCLEDRPRVLDCVEFDDELRHVDVADDLAFLMMDLERLAAPDLAERLLSAYEAAADTSLPRPLLDFYVAYRALVRCMVACTRTQQSIGAVGTESGQLARQLLDLAVLHLRAALPRLVLIGGLPGTGKSTVSIGVAGRLESARVVRSDVVRKELAGLAATESAAADFGAGIYDEAGTDRTYRGLAERARAELELGRTVVLDASFNAARHREWMRSVATETKSPIVELRCVLDPDEADRRIRRRHASEADASDASPLIRSSMAEMFDPWPEAERLSTVAAPADLIDGALRAVDLAV